MAEMNWRWASTRLASLNEGAVASGCWALSHSWRRQGRPGKLLRTHFTSTTYKQRKSNKRGVLQFIIIPISERSVCRKPHRIHYTAHFWNPTMHHNKLLSREIKTPCLWDCVYLTDSLHYFKLHPYVPSWFTRYLGKKSNQTQRSY